MKSMPQKATLHFFIPQYDTQMKRIWIVLLIALFSFNLSSFCRGGNTLRVISYNIHAGIGLDKKKDLVRLAKIIRQYKPDYVGLQEVDSMTRRSGGIDQAAELSKLTGMYALYAPAIPHQGGKYGIAALVKKLPLNWNFIPMPGKEEARTLLIMEYKHYILCNTHMSLTKESQAEAITIIQNKFKNTQKPIIFTGDFNMTPESANFHAMQDTWTLLSSETTPTFPANEPNIAIDFVWGIKGFGYKVKETEVIEAPIESDHRPIFVKLKIARQ